MSERKPTAIVQLKVRMRESMRAEIERAAKEAGHSMNAEIVKRLDLYADRSAMAEEVFLAAVMAGSVIVPGELRERIERLEAMLCP